jgi:hypothetical protein
MIDCRRDEDVDEDADDQDDEAQLIGFKLITNVGGIIVSW